MKVDLHNQVALVTGAAGGIGRGAAQALADSGARVIVADIDEAEASGVAAELPDAMALRMDVSSESEVDAGVARIKAKLGRIDILVNNAGINTGNRVTVDRFRTADWDAIMAVDLRGVFLVGRAVSALMLEQGSGRIVNIASITGLVPMRLQCAYTAAKAGVINLTRAMAIELAGRGIAVNCVAPGSAITAMTEVFYGKNAVISEQAQRLIDHIPAGRVATIEEIAQAILFFADPKITYITGQTLCVDGGWSAGGYLRDF